MLLEIDFEYKIESIYSYLNTILNIDQLLLTKVNTISSEL